MKSVLFIDFDGTLCHDRFWKSIDASSFEQIQNFLFSENKSIIRDWMKGVYSSEDINRLISKRLNISFEKLWKVFVDDCTDMMVSRDSLNRIKKLKKDYKTILITDNMDCFTRFTVPALNLSSYFDSIVNSFENKKFKEYNEGEIFIQLADDAHTKIEDCILIDNSKTACATFSKLGGKSCFVTAETSLDYWLGNLHFFPGLTNS